MSFVIVAILCAGVLAGPVANRFVRTRDKGSG